MLRWFHGQPLPHWLDQVMLYFPYVGTNLTILPLVILLALWLWRRSNKVLTAIHLLVVCIGSLVAQPDHEVSARPPAAGAVPVARAV